MDEIERLKKFVNLMEETELEELEWEKNGLHIVLKKKPERSVKKGEKPEAILSPSEKSSLSAKPGAKFVEVKSKMVGTFYRAPVPDMPAFIKEGSLVKKGDKLCVIESMKIMREVISELSGKIVSILLNNGDPVEYGQVLFLIEPTHQKSI